MIVWSLDVWIGTCQEEQRYTTLNYTGDLPPK